MTQTPPPFPGPHRGQAAGQASDRFSNPTPNQFAPPNPFPNQFQTAKQFARPAAVRARRAGAPVSIRPTPLFSAYGRAGAGPRCRSRRAQRSGRQASASSCSCSWPEPGRLPHRADPGLAGRRGRSSRAKALGVAPSRRSLPAASRRAGPGASDSADHADPWPPTARPRRRRRQHGGHRGRQDDGRRRTKATAAAPPALHPEVVQIAPTPAPTTPRVAGEQGRRADRGGGDEEGSRHANRRRLPPTASRTRMPATRARRRSTRRPPKRRSSTVRDPTRGAALRRAKAADSARGLLHTLPRWRIRAARPRANAPSSSPRAALGTLASGAGCQRDPVAPTPRRRS